MKQQRNHNINEGRIGVGFTLLASLWISAVAFASNDPKLGLGLNLYGAAADNGPSESRVAGTELSAKLSQSLLEEVTLNAEALLTLETGSSRTLYSEEFKPRQGFRLKEGALTVRPTSYLSFVAGAVDQDRWHQPLLLSKQSFPSLVEALELKDDYFVRLEAIQAFASDTSNLQPWNDFGKESATFYLERLTVGKKWADDTDAEIHASHFLFDGLSPQLAYQSRFLGNSVSGVAVPSSRFESAFKGFEVGASARFAWNPYANPQASFSWLVNPEASADKNQAWRAAAAVSWSPKGTYRITPGVEYFRVESDVSPAVFNSRARGHNGRSGYGITLTGELRPSGTSIAAEWFDTAPIGSNSIVSSLQWFQLSLRTSYDIL